MDQQAILSKIPFVNYTLVEETLKNYYGDQEPPVELFPRWIAQTKLFNEAHSSQTGAYLVAVDTELERRIVIGHNFPNRVLGVNEMITTTDVLKLLGTQIGEHIEVNVSLRA